MLKPDGWWKYYWSNGYNLWSTRSSPRSRILRRTNMQGHASHPWGDSLMRLFKILAEGNMTKPVKPESCGESREMSWLEEEARGCVLYRKKIAYKATEVSKENTQDKMEKLPIVQFSLHTGCLASNIGNRQTMVSIFILMWTVLQTGLKCRNKIF